MHKRRWTVVALATCTLAGVVPSTLAQGAEASNSAPVTVPAIRSWVGNTGLWQLTGTSRIVLDPAAAQTLTATANLLAGEIAEQEGIRPPVLTGTPQANDIALSLGTPKGVSAPEGHELAIGSAAKVTGRTRQAVFYGTRTLLQALRTSSTPRSVGRGVATDWPTHGSRGQMLDVGRKYFPLDYLRQQIRQAAWYKLNTLHLHLSDWNGYRIASERYPEIVASEHYTAQQLRELEDYADSYGVTIVPEIDLPGHAAAIGKAKPELAFTCDSMSRPKQTWEGSDQGQWTLDYTKPETRTFARNLVKEVADIFRKSPYVHVGTDEVPPEEKQKACPELVAYQESKGYPYTGDVLVEFINELDSAVRATGKTTQVWQWWDYRQKTSLTPDKGIIVNEWLSSPDGRAAQGYKVIGAEENSLYVSPGLGDKPGKYGFFDIRTVYRDYPFVQKPGVLGYRVARWSDRTQKMAVGWVDHFARRPLAVVADRTWGTPAGSDVRPFLDRYDQVGDALPARKPDPGNLDSQIGVNPGMASQNGWSVSATSQETAGEPGQAGRAADNDPYTIWHSDWDARLPQQLSVNLGSERKIAGIRYMARQDGGSNGRVKAYEVLVSKDGASWQKAATGSFPGDRAEFVVPFTPVTARYVALRVLSEHGPENRYAAVAELDVVQDR